MVAYSFNRQFVPAIENGMKSQTIRLNRKRHARPGERLQLYTGMRTKACRLIRDDVICSRLDEVSFDLRALKGEALPSNSRQLEDLCDRVDLPLRLNGEIVPDEMIDFFAMHDGFMGWSLNGEPGVQVSPFAAMVMFWMGNHGPRMFEGVLIRWEKAQ